MNKEKEVEEALENGYRATRKQLFQKDISQAPSKKYDITTMCLEAITMEVEELEGTVNDLRDPLYFKKYKTLQGQCSKLLADLDNLKVEGRDDIRNARKELLIRIETGVDILAKKMHSADEKINGD